MRKNAFNIGDTVWFASFPDHIIGKGIINQKDIDVYGHVNYHVLTSSNGSYKVMEHMCAATKGSLTSRFDCSLYGFKDIYHIANMLLLESIVGKEVIVCTKYGLRIGTVRKVTKGVSRVFEFGTDLKFTMYVVPVGKCLDLKFIKGETLNIELQCEDDFTSRNFFLDEEDMLAELTRTRRMYKDAI